MNTISFPNIFNKNNHSLSTTLSYSIESINECLNTIFHVNKGELLGDPDYGTTIRERLFDLANPLNIGELKRDLATFINQYIPRIKTDSSMIKIYTNGNNNHYKITIRYIILSNSVEGNFETVVSN